MNNSTIAAVIPAYQEQKHVGEVAQRALTQLEHVLVVDDGSTDATADRARAAGVDVVVHPQNRGKGESIKTGLRYWFDRGSEYVVLLDADGQHLPEEILRFVDATASEAEPPRLIDGDCVARVAFDVGAVMVTAGAVVSGL